MKRTKNNNREMVKTISLLLFFIVDFTGSAR